MTIQIVNPTHGRSKAALQAALNAGPEGVKLDDPWPWGQRTFTAATMRPGQSFPVVMDPATRRRFATITRRKDGSFKVT